MLNSVYLLLSVSLWCYFGDESSSADRQRSSEAPEFWSVAGSLSDHAGSSSLLAGSPSPGAGLIG